MLRQYHISQTCAGCINHLGGVVLGGCFGCQARSALSRIKPAIVVCRQPCQCSMHVIITSAADSGPRTVQSRHVDGRHRSGLQGAAC